MPQIWNTSDPWWFACKIRRVTFVIAVWLYCVYLLVFLIVHLGAAGLWFQAQELPISRGRVSVSYWDLEHVSSVVTEATCSFLVISQGFFFFPQSEGRVEINSIDLSNKNIIFNATFGYIRYLLYLFLNLYLFFFNHAELVVIELIMLISLDLFSVRICFRTSEFSGVLHVEAISYIAFTSRL